REVQRARDDLLPGRHSGRGWCSSPHRARRVPAVQSVTRRKSRCRRPNGAGNAVQERIMKYRLLHRLILAAIAALPALATAADQSAQLAGSHGLPVFVRERIELTPGISDEPTVAGARSDARTPWLGEDAVVR